MQLMCLKHFFVVVLNALLGKESGTLLFSNVKMLGRESERNMYRCLMPVQFKL